MAEKNKGDQVERLPVNVDVVNPHVFKGSYMQGLQIALNHLSPYLTEKQRQKLIDEKLMLKDAHANVDEYLQAATELVVCAWFASLARLSSFTYEAKVNPPKDVDCAFTVEGMQFNVEVKCAHFERQRDITANTDLRMHYLGRLDGILPQADELKRLFASSEQPVRLELAHHMDLKLKDYLLSAQSKFPADADLNQLNVLIVGVDDQMDMNQWVGYLMGEKGLFTARSFEPIEHYKNVDLVVFSNLYHRHYRADLKGRISSHWNFSEAFNVLLKNPRSEKPDQIFECFFQYVPNENQGLYEYGKDGDLIKNALLIPHYVAYQQFANSIYRFQGPPKEEKQED